MKVGIDLSSTNTGFVILSDDNKLIWHSNFKLWDNDAQKPNRVAIRELFDIINCKRLKETNIKIGVELSDFGNWKYADRFNFIAGALYQEHYNQEWGFIGDFVCFNSNEWQSILKKNYEHVIKQYKENKKTYYIFYCSTKNKPFLIFKKIFDKKRQLLKALSRDFAMWNCVYYEDDWTEDECDAYCIAYFLDKLRDRREMHQEVKLKKVQTKENKISKLRNKLKTYNKIKKLYEIVNHYKDLAIVKKLTKAQQRALEKAKQQLKEYENDNK